VSIISMNGVGLSADKPHVLGVADGTDPLLVETTGLYEGIPKGQQVWVTGSKVQVGIARGSLIPIAVDGFPLVEKVTRVSTVEPPTIASTTPWSLPADEPTSPPPPPVEADVEPVDPADLDPNEPVRYNPAEHSAAAVIAYIEEHPDEAAAVIAAERAGKNRKTILREFE
jgi:hypothetical protein